MSRLWFMVFCWAAVVGVAEAQEKPADPANGWFPIAPGNYWVYKADKGPAPPLRMEIEEAVGEFFRLSNPFGVDILVRTRDDARVEIYNPDTEEITLWYDFEAAERTDWPSRGQPCTDEAQVADRDVRIATPAGAFEKTLKIAYSPGSCADAGTTLETFAWGVGMVEHVETTIAGPVRYQLIEARVGDKMFEPAAPAVRIGLELNERVFQRNHGRTIPVLRATLRVDNHSAGSMQMEFPSGQQFEAQIIGPSGEPCYTWSATRSFIQAATTMTIEPGAKEFPLEVTLGDAEKPWPAGSYVLRTWIPSGSQARIEAQMPFEIVD